MTQLAYVNLTASDGSTSTAEVGSTFETKGAQWIYVKASTAITAYQACVVASDGTIGPATHGGTYPTSAVVRTICIAQFAFASGDYGWAWCGPGLLREDDSSNFKVSALTLCVLDVIVYTTGTAGSIDDTSSSQEQIQGLYLASTVGGSTANTACFATRRMTVNS